MEAYRVLSQTVIGLMPSAPGAAGASGSAMLNFETQQVEVTAIGLPAPSFFGTDPSTGRPFNVYEAWLVSTSENLFASLGEMKLVAGAYVVRARSPIPLTEFNSIVITPEDKMGPQFISGPWVMTGMFTQVVPMPKPRG